MTVKNSLCRYLYGVLALLLLFSLLGTGVVLYPRIFLNPEKALYLYRYFLAIGILVTVLSSFFIFSLIRTWNKPLTQILRTAERYAQGNLDPRLTIHTPYEFHVLGETLNWMAQELKNRIDTIALQRNELEGILSSMIEAVILLDAEDRIKTMNHAAETLTRHTFRESVGKLVYEIIEAEEVKECIHTIRLNQESIERTIKFPWGDKTLYLQVHGSFTPSPPLEGQLLLVLNDITRLKQLEEMRKDFVANVSHELRTPITSILGFVETLKEGALQNPETSLRFLSIIENQSRRLYSIIEDLLDLSRLEQAETEIRFEEASLSDLFEEVRTLSMVKAEEKRILLRFNAVEDISLRLNPLLIVQALVNLVENAIKYCAPGSVVEVSARRDAEGILFSVKDTGPGIPREELPRIFERFYRIDKTRSRSSGGTGLGLAIVKHIALVHGGSVSVESEVGKGSTFYLTIPQKEDRFLGRIGNVSATT
jgi:two-component system phosphate regulon sensor histidine kinase PhoR